MKHIMRGLVAALILILVTMAVATVNTRHQREEEVNNALRESVKETIVNLTTDKKYELYGDTLEERNTEFVADFCQLLLNDIEVGDAEAWDSAKAYRKDERASYIVDGTAYVYKAIADVPIGTPPTDTTYWKETYATEDKNLMVKVEVAGVDYEKGLLSLKVTETFTYPLGGVGTTSVEETAVLDTSWYNKTFTISFLYPDNSVKKTFIVSAGQNLNQIYSIMGSNYTYMRQYLDNEDKDSAGNPKSKTEEVNNRSQWPSKAEGNYTFVGWAE